MDDEHGSGFSIGAARHLGTTDSAIIKSRAAAAAVAARALPRRWHTAAGCGKTPRRFGCGRVRPSCPTASIGERPSQTGTWPATNEVPSGPGRRRSPLGRPPLRTLKEATQRMWTYAEVVGRRLVPRRQVDLKLTPAAGDKPPPYDHCSIPSAPRIYPAGRPQFDLFAVQVGNDQVGIVAVRYRDLVGGA